MKKIFFLALSCFLISGCTWPPIEAPESTSIDSKVDFEESAQEEVEEVVEEEKERNTREEEIDQFIRVSTPINGETFHAWEMEPPIEFLGQVSSDTVKITVTARYQELTWDEVAEDLYNVEKTDVYTLGSYTAGDTSFAYRAAPEWNNLGFGQNQYEFVATHEDGNQSSMSMSITYEADGLGKPVVYLYPQSTQKITVSVAPENGLTVSIPEMFDAWRVLATPNGKLLNLRDMKSYPYLFWEGFAPPHEKSDEGFVVKTEELAIFFEEKLTVLGLNAQEIADFNDYWLQQMDTAPFYFIHFVDQSYLDTHAPLLISPKPDSVIRVYFDYSPLDKWQEVEEQVLEKRERHGFAVTEWGGPMILPN